MRRNIIIISVLVLLVLVVWLSLQKSNKSTSNNEEANSNVNTDIEIPAEDNTNEKPKSAQAKEQTEPKLTENQKANDTVERALKLLEERRYSSDPLVEFQSVVSEFGYCHENIMSFVLKDKELSEKKSLQLEKLNQRCETLKNKYEFLGEISQSREITQALKAIPSSSSLGDMYRDENQAAIRADFPAYFNRLTQQGIKAQNSQTLTMSAQIMNQSFFSVDSELFEILGGLDENYIRRVQNNALSLMSCDYQEGTSCLPEGQLMVDKCLENDLFCDMNFVDWYQLYTTDAHKSDVEVLLAHYRNL